MKKYIEFGDFKEILNKLSPDQGFILYIEDNDDYSTCYFKCICFNGINIILYSWVDGVGIIQSAYNKTREESIAETWEYLNEQQCKMYVEVNLRYG